MVRNPIDQELERNIAAREREEKIGPVARSRKLLPRVRLASEILLVAAEVYLILYWRTFLT